MTAGGARRVGRRLLAGLAALTLAGCTGSTTPTPIATATPLPTTAPTPTRNPTGTSAPTLTLAPTIGEPADDGARVIAISAPTTLPQQVQAGADFIAASPIPVTRVRDLTIESPAIARLVHVRLLLPAHYDSKPAGTWPVLYLLSGQDGTYDGWTVYLDAVPMTAATDLLVVMADQGAEDPNGSSFTDWWNGGKGGPPMWETFHLVELRQLLERNWRAGDKRAIAGPSAGGYGAMEYATRQPGMFRFAGSFSGGGLHPTGEPSSEPIAKWGDQLRQADIWKAHDPWENAGALKGMALFVAYGNGEPGALDDYAISPWDPTGESERYCAKGSAAFVERLKALNIPVTVFAYGNGTHGAAYFRRDLEEALPLILKAVGL
jgi:S-formylglutathione hydrolase FrmB